MMSRFKLGSVLLTLSVGLILVQGRIAHTTAQSNPSPAATRTAGPFPTASPVFTGTATPAPASTVATVPSTPATNPTGTTTSSAPPKVIGLDGHLELDDIIRVEIDHLAEWATTNDASKLVPFINGRAIRGCYPVEIHAAKNHLHYHLLITSENKHVWVDLLGAPEGIRKPVVFSIGPENQGPFDSVFDQSHETPLTVISPLYGVIAFIVVFLTLIMLIRLARKTNIIRGTGPAVPGKLRPYNLGRAQMAFWFFLVYASYVVIWLVTNALDTITPSLLALIGISSGTALSEALIDQGKDETRTNQLRELTAEAQSLQQTIPELESQVTAVNAKATLTPDDQANRDKLSRQLQESRTRLDEVDLQVESLTPKESAGVSAGFFRDLLSDAGGYSFHRFQIFAWTIVLGIIFVSSVYNSLTMPEFSSTMLGLMGISSGTYIGFKFPEQK
jgi:hypothetical protein